MKHTPFDGRGYREVFVDGVKVDHVLFADSSLGYVEVACFPFEVCDKTHTIRTQFLYGEVTVKEVK